MSGAALWKNITHFSTTKFLPLFVGYPWGPQDLIWRQNSAWVMQQNIPHYSPLMELVVGEYLAQISSALSFFTAHPAWSFSL
jgi:hypothetical protein